MGGVITITLYAGRALHSLQSFYPPSLLLSNSVSQGSFGTKHASPDGKRRERITFNQFLHCAKPGAGSTSYGMEVKRPT